MYRPSIQELQEYDLDTTVGFSSLKMEPYKKGVIAFSERHGSFSMSSYLEKLTFLCRQRMPMVVFYTPGRIKNRATSGEFRMVVADRDVTKTTQPDNMTVTVNSTGTYFTVRLEPQIATLMGQSSSVVFSLAYSAAEGGWFSFVRDFSDMDRQMINAAFRFCI